MALTTDELKAVGDKLKAALDSRSASDLVGALTALRDWQPTIEGLRETGLGRVVKLVARKTEELHAHSEGATTTTRSSSTTEASFGLARSLSVSMLADWQTAVEAAAASSADGAVITIRASETREQVTTSGQDGSTSTDTTVKRSRDVEISAPAASSSATTPTKKPRLLTSASASSSSSSSLSDSGDWPDAEPASPSRFDIRQEVPPADVRLSDKDKKMVDLLTNVLLTPGPDGMLAGGLAWKRSHAVAVAMKIVAACHANHERSFAGKMRSLLFNLKSVGNDGLRHRILSQSLPADDLLNLDAGAMCDPANADLMRAVIESAQRADERDDAAPESDMFECRRCKKRRVTYFQMQTRSADEPMTVFIRCLVCGNRWRE